MRPTLRHVPTPTIRRELDRRRRKITLLERQRQALLAQKRRVEVQIIAAGGTVECASNGKRPHNKLGLRESLAKVLRGRQMGVTEVAGAVQKAGYRTGSKTFRTIVNQTLIKNPGTFKKVSRGLYTAA